jgi:hypothetical protein
MSTTNPPTTESATTSTSAADKRKETIRKLAEQQAYEAVLMTEWGRYVALDPQIVRPWDALSQEDRNAMLTGFTLCMSYVRRKVESKRGAGHGN